MSMLFIKALIGTVASGLVVGAYLVTASRLLNAIMSGCTRKSHPASKEPPSPQQVLILHKIEMASQAAAVVLHHFLVCLLAKHALHSDRPKNGAFGLWPDVRVPPSYVIALLLDVGFNASDLVRELLGFGSMTGMDSSLVMAHHAGFLLFDLTVILNQGPSDYGAQLLIIMLGASAVDLVVFKILARTRLPSSVLQALAWCQGALWFSFRMLWFASVVYDIVTSSWVESLDPFSAIIIRGGVGCMYLFNLLAGTSIASSIRDGPRSRLSEGAEKPTTSESRKPDESTVGRLRVGDEQTADATSTAKPARGSRRRKDTKTKEPKKTK